MSASKKVGVTKRTPPNAGKGRPKGSLNKVTATVKEALQQAFQEVGGARWLVGLAGTDPKAFATLLGKLIPTDVKAEVTGKDGGPVETRDLSGLSTDDLAKLAAILEKAGGKA